MEARHKVKRRGEMNDNRTKKKLIQNSVITRTASGNF